MHTLIYCDIDGVLHRWPCKVEEMFDTVCIGLLDRTLRDRNVGIVITSTWRLEWPLETPVPCWMMVMGVMASDEVLGFAGSAQPTEVEMQGRVLGCGE